MSDRTVAKKRRRHVPVRGATHVYWSETKKGRVYEVRHPINADGQRLYEVVGTRLDAAKARARAVHGGNAPRVLSVSITLGEVYDAWKESRELRPRSEESFDGVYERHIRSRFARVKVREIDSQMLLAWLAGLKRQDGRDGPLASGTKRLCLAVLQMILQHGVEMGALPAVPKLPQRRTPKAGEGRRRIVTLEEEVQLLWACKRLEWLRPIIRVALHQALRLGEVAGLQWEDVDFASGKLTVRYSLGRDGTLGPTKGGRVQVIDLTPAAREALLALLPGPGATGFVFRNTIGGARQLRDVQRAFDKARTRAGLAVTDDGPVVFHSLRHTGISRLANHPAIPLVQVRDFARHADLATTQGYCHAIESDAVKVAFAEALAG